VVRRAGGDIDQPRVLDHRRHASSSVGDRSTQRAPRRRSAAPSRLVHVRRRITGLVGGDLHRDVDAEELPFVGADGHRSEPDVSNRRSVADLRSTRPEEPRSYAASVGPGLDIRDVIVKFAEYPAIPSPHCAESLLVSLAGRGPRRTAMPYPG
jgi:hypothetical protein